jgi:uncharacterized membrane protein
MQVKIFTIIVVLFTSISILKSQESADQIAISELLKIDKMLDNHLAIIDRAIDDFQNDLDQVPRRFWEKQKKELKKEYDKSIESNLGSTPI